VSVPHANLMALPGMTASTEAGATTGSMAPTAPPTLPEMPFPLPDWLAGNPYFTAGFGLGAMGFVMSFARTGAASAESILRRQVLMSLEIPSKDYAYQWVMQWLVAKGVHGSRHLGVETTYAKDSAGRQFASFDFVPSPGRHWVRYKGNFIRIERDREHRTMDMSTGSPWETLTLTTLSLRPTLFQELLQEAKEAALLREEGKTLIFQSYGHEWRPFGSPKTIRPFSSVILDGNASQEILQDVSEFLKCHEWYLARGIPYRRGYLLHGPPGCGKSSFVMAMAGQLGYNIAVLNLGDPSMTDDRLQHLLAVVPPKCLVLLEDVDFAVGQSTPSDPSGPYAGVMRVSFSGLLNALDGVVATEERIVFMTTNHFRRLPRALIRPGRVDLNIFVGLATKIQLKRMFLRFFPEQEVLADQFQVLCNDEGLSMAELQGFFMFFKDQPEACVANVGPWLEARRQAVENPERHPQHKQQEQTQQELSSSEGATATQAPAPAQDAEQNASPAEKTSPSSTAV